MIRLHSSSPWAKPLPLFMMAFILAACLASAVSTGAAESKWVFVGYTKYRDAVFIDMNRWSRSESGQVQIWSRITPSEKSKYYRQIRRDLMKANKPWVVFRHIETMNEIDCLRGNIRYVEVLYYNREGGLIHATRDENPSWKVIKPGSLWDSLQTAVCK